MTRQKAVAAVGLVAKGGSRAQTASSQSTLNRSVTLSNIAPKAGVQVSSVLHRERTGVYAVTTPDQEFEIGTFLLLGRSG